MEQTRDLLAPMSLTVPSLEHVKDEEIDEANLRFGY